jgi:hypothetical protein
MYCHICQDEAVGRCYTCGGLFCAAHGQVNCTRCETAVAAGDPRPDRFSVVPMASTYRPGWWRPQVAEAFDPPACYQCKGLARRICRHCSCHYCPEHAGRGNMCAACARSSWLGIVILLTTLFLLGILVLAGYLSGV